MTDYHEDWASLPDDVRDFHRALKSLQEELEAVDWYTQRIALCANDELRAVLAHNRDEEMEHAAMSLEWLRRAMPSWDRALRPYLFTERPIEREEQAAASGRAALADLGIGSLKQEA